MTAEDANADLDKWFQSNLWLIPSYKHMQERKIDFMNLNKTERLGASIPENKEARLHELAIID